jgi:hypothetical protein
MGSIIRLELRPVLFLFFHWPSQQSNSVFTTKQPEFILSNFVPTKQIQKWKRIITTEHCNNRFNQDSTLSVQQKK